MKVIVRWVKRKKYKCDNCRTLHTAKSRIHNCVGYRCRNEICEKCGHHIEGVGYACDDCYATQFSKGGLSSGK